jgi:predicted nucleotidyltransferase
MVAPKKSTRTAKAHSAIRLWHPEVPGPLWDGTRRVGRNQIEAYCRVVAREFKPEKIILFGSYACGKATKDSDVDLVVIMPFRGSDTKQMVQIRTRVEAPFPMDMLVWKPGKYSRMPSFNHEVMTRGKVMYEG